MRDVHLPMTPRSVVPQAGPNPPGVRHGQLYGAGGSVVDPPRTVYLAITLQGEHKYKEALKFYDVCKRDDRWHPSHQHRSC